MLLYLNFILILLSMMLFFMRYNHFLMTLISLEFFVFSIMYSIYVLKLMESMGEYLIILYMVMAVCSSVVGLMIIVCFIRILGVETYNLINSIN